MNKLSDKKIIDSWGKNAQPWIAAVREKQIESRNLITDQAIVDSIMTVSGNSVFDIGCGEGWLAQQLVSQGLDVYGVDVIPALVEEARQISVGDFEVMAYENISRDTIKRKFDIAVANFSLLGKESVDQLFTVLPTLLNTDGYFIVQTPHPVMSCGDLAYKDGWREGSWAGFSHDFSDPAPWYFRTIESWLALYLENNFQISQIRAPIAPNTGKPASLIMVGKLLDE
jgi:2-polyprenyl-3-methyl-5-hydroxy-6-metoxy-1,4-benzoquinol methylase